MGKELRVVSVERSICPDIYHPAIARDGLLTRLRIPGGVLNQSQCQAIIYSLETTGLEYIQVTNRANLQLRALAQDLNPQLLMKLADCGLAASNITIDGIRNIMLSPTAGIDSQELIDVRPLAEAWQQYLDGHPELGILSTKFSVGFDGGGSVSILDRPNDITLLAISQHQFSLYLGIGERGSAPLSVGVRLTAAECLPMLAAIAESYRQGIVSFGGDARRKPRLREMIDRDGLTAFSELVQREFAGSKRFIFKNLDSDQHQIRGNSDSLSALATAYRQVEADAPRWRSLRFALTETLRERHLGVHQQLQTGNNYLGVVLPLGRWTVAQIKGLGSISVEDGNGTLRLTPWQNLIIPDLKTADVARVQALITDLGLVQTANHPSSLLRACAGSTGCKFSATDTQRDAIDLSNYLAANFRLDRPLNIHFSGCEKSCAQHDHADITLWGDDSLSERSGLYRLAIDGATAEFGQDSSDLLPPERVPISIGNLIAAYQDRRIDPQESFATFTSRQSLAQLQQLLHAV
jgi:ferredoxin-nitrite reductase